MLITLTSPEAPVRRFNIIPDGTSAMERDLL
jgi:hypothetical protein